ncbi:Cytochrome c oxidase subunit 5A, mitochondrial [Lamellibrachia satsuma]|nr:Cytochrome c oxidase subunit 5A, mitochondrial [Lamellibrachia satsuma]
MLRSVASRLGSAVCSAARTSVQRTCAVTQVRYRHDVEESAEEFDNRYEAFFNRQDVDGWDIRKAMNDLQGLDLVPEPRIVIAALKACRRVNDYALAVRYMEAVQNKCGDKVGEIWPYLRQEIKPTLDELGILTPEEMGYDKPELAVEDVMDM